MGNYLSRGHQDSRLQNVLERPRGPVTADIPFTSLYPCAYSNLPMMVQTKFRGLSRDRTALNLNSLCVPAPLISLTSPTRRENNARETIHLKKTMVPIQNNLLHPRPKTKVSSLSRRIRLRFCLLAETLR
jgi:hypothetical protein